MSTASSNQTVPSIEEPHISDACQRVNGAATRARDDTQPTKYFALPNLSSQNVAVVDPLTFKPDIPFHSNKEERRACNRTLPQNTSSTLVSRVRSPVCGLRTPIRPA